MNIVRNLAAMLAVMANSSNAFVINTNVWFAYSDSAAYMRSGPQFVKLLSRSPCAIPEYAGKGWKMAKIAYPASNGGVNACWKRTENGRQMVSENGHPVVRICVISPTTGNSIDMRSCEFEFLQRFLITSSLARRAF